MSNCVQPKKMSTARIRSGKQWDACFIVSQLFQGVPGILTHEYYVEPDCGHGIKNPPGSGWIQSVEKVQ